MAGSRTRETKLFIIDEEVCAIAALDQVRDQDRAADPYSGLIENHDLPRSSGLVIEKVVGIQPGVAMIPITAAMVFVPASAGAESDMGRTFTGAFRARHG